MNGTQLRRPECVGDGKSTSETVIESFDERHHALVADPPVRRDDRSRARLKQRRRQSLHPLAADQHASGRTTRREHDQVRIERECREVAGSHEPVLAIAGCECERGARQRLLIDERVGSQMQHAVLSQVSVSEERGCRVTTESYIGGGRVPRNETRFA